LDPFTGASTLMRTSVTSMMLSFTKSNLK
jgi:hypothetical protein